MMFKKIGKFFKKVFNSAIRKVNKFLKIAIPQILKLAYAELQEFAISVVKNLEYEDLANEEKRQKAFDEIKVRASYKSKEISDSAINLLIELAVQYIRKEKE
ncbi:hypothetical protein AKJ59_00755 [candidate division MSBL1 archaeon SCGC-AAA385M02]|uniref:Uncharacterized protein n=1 Tax=candidate division MSBL1 archaeon SCGC-AAA385M02 TaxID=1698287 RepID=A0A133VQ86_9EURY|nr:hypothetical protein AKJ59_00755 [candidate division MSBL1 archaeon SCGC-AAA385M02]